MATIDRLGPLSSLRVLDLTTFLSGPYCTQILGDLGAQVIKLEHPKGDMTRGLPPHFIDGDSAYYLSCNRNKQSVAIDLGKGQGRRLLTDMAQQVDILVENFRPGVVNRFGLSYQDLAEVNPGIIWCSITGFGQDGPYRDRPAYDMIIQALSGVMSLTGEPGGPPVRTGIPLSDLAAGMYAVIGILAALAERSESGLGQEIDVSLLDCQISMLSYLGLYHLVSGEVASRQGRSHESIPTYRSFSAADGEEVVVTANTDAMWQGLCKVLNVHELLEDERFTSNEARNQNRNQLWEILERAFSKRPSHELAQELVEAGVPAATINSLNHTLADPQVLHRGMVVEVQKSSGSSVRLLGDPIRLSRTRRQRHRYPPKLGEDTYAILTDLLQLSDDRIGELVEAGVVFAQPPQES